MATKKRPESPESKKRKNELATTPEGREAQLIAAAVDLAEKRILDGTASNQLLIHFLKRADPKEKIEKEILERQKDLIVAKTENLESQKRTEELYQKAIDAMRIYNGQSVLPDEELQ